MFDFFAVAKDELRARRWALSLLAACFLTIPVTLPAAADVLLRSDFSSTSWYTNWQNHDTVKNYSSEPSHTIRIPANTSTAAFEAIDGAALQITIPQGENIGTGLSFFPRTVLGNDPVELYLRYNLRFGSTWTNEQNGKLPGFGGTYGVGGWGGKASNGTNGWSARGKFGEPCENGKINLGSYVYHADMSGQFGSGFSWTDGCSNGLNKNQWYAIEYYVRVNTPGQRNGILRGWIDDKLVMEKTDLRFDDTGDFKIERVWMNVYHGGAKVAPQDMHLFIDNVVVSQEPIGTKFDNTKKPKPPELVGAN